MRELVDSYFIIKVGDLFLKDYKTNMRSVEFAESESNALRFNFEENQILNWGEIPVNEKFEVFGNMLSVCSQLSGKGFDNISYLEKHVYREETTKQVAIKSYGGGAIQIIQDEHEEGFMGE